MFLNRFSANFFKNSLAVTMKRITKEKASKSDRVTRSKSDSNQEKIKIDLSRFKKQPKPQLVLKTEPVQQEISEKAIKEETKKPIKREHIKIEADQAETTEITPPKTKKSSKIPEKWKEVLENLREMRKNFDAPVDSMGCHKCHDEEAPPQVIRYQNLLALMLSSQTKDPIVHAAMKRLQDHGCTIEKILNTSDTELEQLIHPVSFYKRKAIYIKKTSDVLKNEYNGDIPKTAEGLCKLPGVGPKMAHLCMRTAWNELTGIGVDTHVHRISNRLGWANTKTPEETRRVLEDWLPRENWSEVNHLLVGFGQQVCQSVKPQCSSCLNRDICPFGAEFIRNGPKTLSKTKKK